MPEVLTAAQSEARIRQLRAEGYTVEREVLPDGTVVVRKSLLPSGLGWALVLLVGLGGCWAYSGRGGR